MEDKENPLSIFRKSQDWLRNRLPTKFRSYETREKEKSDLLETYIKRGLDLIKQDRFQEAVGFFDDEARAQELGFSGITFNMVGGNTDNPEGYSQQELLTLTDICAQHSRVNFGGQHGFKPRPEDLLPGMSLDQSKRPPRLDLAKIQVSVKGQEVNLPPFVYQNLSLIHAEEWIHGLQFYRNGQVAGVGDAEIDVAKYMLDNGLELTPQFLARYGRANQLTKPPQTP